MVSFMEDIKINTVHLTGNSDLRKRRTTFKTEFSRKSHYLGIKNIEAFLKIMRFQILPYFILEA